VEERIFDIASIDVDQVGRRLLEPVDPRTDAIDGRASGVA
jgi:hypothetical protein